MTQPEGEHSAHEGMEGMDMSTRIRPLKGLRKNKDVRKIIT